MKKIKVYTLKSLIIKISIFSVLILGLILSISLTPKELFNKDSAYSFCVNNVVLRNDEDLATYRILKYYIQSDYETGLTSGVNKVKEELKEKNLILAVKIFSLEKVTYVNNDYVVIKDPSIKKNEIECYIVRNVKFQDKELPCDIFLSNFYNMLPEINNYYLIGLITLHSLLLVAFIIPDVIYIVKLAKLKNNKDTSLSS